MDYGQKKRIIIKWFFKKCSQNKIQLLIGLKIQVITTVNYPMNFYQALKKKNNMIIQMINKFKKICNYKKFL